ncbi:MAG: fumarylacetoacetate hydrolase family protein [Candidatus Dormibacteraeota bacterium]|nr:fumarylacetoacetate hydrolase family protein [Candidatus Dormibacteraeota bacterium]
MRLGTIRAGGGTRCVLVRDGAAVELPYADVVELLAGDPDWARVTPPSGAATHDVTTVEWAPLVVRPGKIFCLGHNYRKHIAEMKRDMPSYPTLFAKFPEALIGARDDIVLPAVSEKPDWEAELGLVIGRAVRRESPERCADAIAGYTVVNDITMRDWQKRTLQWLQGKTFEASTPVGPVLVTPDELDGAHDLHLRCEVDGEVVQETQTSDMLFAPADIVSYISMVITLKPGDLVSTGTPGGVGDARTPPRYLRPGQRLRTSIEGIGELDNRCVADGAGDHVARAVSAAGASPAPA